MQLTFGDAEGPGQAQADPARDLPCGDGAHRAVEATACPDRAALSGVRTTGSAAVRAGDDVADSSVAAVVCVERSGDGRGIARDPDPAAFLPSSAAWITFQTRPRFSTFAVCWKPTALPLGCWKRSTPICRARGQSLRSGTIVDATLIAAPSSTKNADRARDPEMHQTKKGNQWYFGMKAHIGVDEFFRAGTPRALHRSQCGRYHGDARIAARQGRQRVRRQRLHRCGKKRDELQSCEAAFFSLPPSAPRFKPLATSARVLGQNVGNTSRQACARRWSTHSG